jgi:RNA polymerase sigma-70 factor (ECF subfamily)
MIQMAPAFEPSRDAPEAACDVETEAAVLRRAALGDERAFAQIYEAQRRRLYRLAYGVLLDPHDAREAVQEAFLALHRALPSWEERAAVGTWLYRVVLNHCLGLRQRLTRWARRLASVPPTRTPQTPEDTATLRQAVAVVTRSLGDLSPRQRAVACLFLEAELSPAEIAPLVRLTPNATRVTLHRALTRVRADLAEAGIVAAPTPGETLGTIEED